MPIALSLSHTPIHTQAQVSPVVVVCRLCRCLLLVFCFVIGFNVSIAFVFYFLHPLFYAVRVCVCLFSIRLDYIVVVCLCHRLCHCPRLCHHLCLCLLLCICLYVCLLLCRRLCLQLVCGLRNSFFHFCCVPQHLRQRRRQRQRPHTASFHSHDAMRHDDDDISFFQFRFLPAPLSLTHSLACACMCVCGMRVFFNIVVECHWSKANAGCAASVAVVVAYCRKTFVRCLLLLFLLFIRIRAKCDVEEGVSELRLAERVSGLAWVEGE